MLLLLNIQYFPEHVVLIISISNICQALVQTKTLDGFAASFSLIRPNSIKSGRKAFGTNQVIPVIS